MDLPKPLSLPSTRSIPIVLPSSPGKLGLAGLSSSPGEGARAPAKPPAPALSVKFTSAPSRDARADVRISLMPLHIFLDVGMALSPDDQGKSQVLQFIDELTASPKTDPKQDLGALDSEDNDTDEEERPTTPRPDNLENERERERRRLEQLVLEDLDLGYDYREYQAGRRIPDPSAGRSKVS